MDTFTTEVATPTGVAVSVDVETPTRCTGSTRPTALYNDQPASESQSPVSKGSESFDTVREDAAHLPTEESEAAAVEALGAAVIELWSKHDSLEKRSRPTVERLKQNRLELGQKLSELKALVCRIGRKSDWKNKLNELNLPKTSADRYVAVYRKTLSDPSAKDTTGVVPATLTPEAIRKMATKIAAQMSKKITAEADVTLFISELSSAMTSSVGAKEVDAAQ